MIRLIDIRKRFGETVAVDGLSLELRQGEIFGLLGPNGAGKTTTISIACGLLKPDSGEATLLGYGPPARPASRRAVGLTPQAIALYEDLSAAENLRFFASLHGIRGRAARDRAAQLLELVGLRDRAGSRVAAFSGGMKRRLNLAASLLHDPPLVILDEPTVGVDPQSRHAIFALIADLRDRAKTVLYTTHYMEEAQRLCDRIAIVDRGRLLALGTPGELIDQHAGAGVIHVRTPAGERAIETREPVKDLQAALAEPHLLSVSLDRPDLESVFLNLTGRTLRDT